MWQPLSKNEAIATRHRDSSLPNPTSFEEAIEANYGDETDHSNPLLFPGA